MKYLLLFNAVLFFVIGIITIKRPDKLLNISTWGARTMYGATFRPGKGHFFLKKIQGFLLLGIAAGSLYFSVYPPGWRTHRYVERSSELPWFLWLIPIVGLVFSLWNIINPNFFVRQQIWITRILGGDLEPGSYPTASRLYSIPALIISLIFLYALWTNR
jgi:hypothetical protein